MADRLAEGRQAVPEPDAAPSSPPTDPRLVLLAACLLPGSGQVLLGQPHRGLTFLFFIVVFGWIGNRVFPDASFFARHAGSIFVYGLAVIEAYKKARIRTAIWQHRQAGAGR